MNQVEDFDVAVVGASLAGCTAATFLGRRYSRVGREMERVGG